MVHLDNVVTFGNCASTYTYSLNQKFVPILHFHLVNKHVNTALFQLEFITIIYIYILVRVGIKFNILDLKYLFKSLTL